MSHDRSLGLRGSLSERALRPCPKAAVLLISWLRAFRSLRRTTVQSNRAHFPRLNVPRFVAIGKATVCLAFKTLLGRLRCYWKFTAAVGARPCWAAQPCWQYLTLCCLQARKINLRQIHHQRRRKHLKSRRRLLRPPGAAGPDTIDACTDTLTANTRWWNTITSN
jgi:hypothetical protein